MLITDHCRVLFLTEQLFLYRYPSLLSILQIMNTSLSSENSGERTNGAPFEQKMLYGPSATEHWSTGEARYMCGRPAVPYAQMIAQAIDSDADKKLTLNAIYNHVLNRYPYFKTAGSGWKVFIIN